MTLKPQKKLFTNNTNKTISDNLIIILVGVVLIGVVIGMSLNKNPTLPKHSAAANSTTFTSNTLAVAKDFACSCGNCGEKNLAACTCSTAVDTKKFIQSNLQSGMPEGDVVGLVKDIYGHYLGNNVLQRIN